MNSVNISLTASEISDLIVSRFLEQIKNPGQKLRPLYLTGHAGIGKSQIVKQAAARAEALIKEITKDKKAKTSCKISTLVFCEPPDFLGLAHIAIDETDKEEMTVFARPSLLPKDGYGILFFDEANRANKEIKSGLLTLIEDREINGHKLGDGWIVVLAGNPSGDRYQGATEFDPALQDRVCPVFFKGNATETVRYLESKYPDHFLVDFLKENPDTIDFEAKTRGTPRGFEYTIRATRNVNTDDLTRNNRELVNLMGCELGLELTTHILGILDKKIKDLTVNEVLNDKVKTIRFLKENKANTDVVALVEKKVREDIVKQLKKYSRKKEMDGEKLYEKTQIENLVSFMEHLPPENFLSMIRGIENDESYDFNLEYVFGCHFTKDSKKLKEFITKLYESSQDAENTKEKAK
jgi:hypothetical protein